MANVLGINLSELSADKVLGKIMDFLSDGRQHYIVTPNPEIILHAHKDEELFYILNKADLSLADGFGLKLAGFLAGVRISRVTGADLTTKLLRLAEKNRVRVAVLNWRGGLSRRRDIELSLRQKYPALVCLVIDASRSHPLPEDITERIKAFAPAILFNTFGSPYQEKFIYHNLRDWPPVRLALGIGGSFDYLTGRAIRAPRIFRTSGLEWLWRLVRQPSRWKRIYNATAVFTGKLLRARLNRHFYRPNVACLLYKKEAGQIKVLIVEREDMPGHWQLPQGGTDGESLKKAGARELREELNTDKFATKATFKDTYSYLFPPVSEQGAYTAAKRFRFDYKGQRQGLYIAEFIGQDQDIKVNFWDHRAWKWIDVHKLVNEVAPVRQTAAKIFLAKFETLNNI
ncbi:MAG: WecB/TagA/CpsF family glycosyltransferase [Patescibacteria group bacterium]